jgi:hypothetical protein
MPLVEKIAPLIRSELIKNGHFHAYSKRDDEGRLPASWSHLPLWRLPLWNPFFLELFTRSHRRPLSSLPPAAMVAGGEWERGLVLCSFRSSPV